MLIYFGGKLRVTRLNCCFSIFRIGPAHTYYQLTIGAYRGTAGMR